MIELPSELWIVAVESKAERHLCFVDEHIARTAVDCHLGSGSSAAVVRVVPAPEGATPGLFGARSWWCVLIRGEAAGGAFRSRAAAGWVPMASWAGAEIVEYIEPSTS